MSTTEQTGRTCTTDRRSALHRAAAVCGAMSDYTEFISYYPSGNDSTATEHLVAENPDDTATVTTACGRELRVQLGLAVADIGRGYVADIGGTKPIGNNKCGNCPWDEVDVE